MPPDSGPCRGSFRKYYFDRSALQCRELRYGGCRGNGNRFTSVEECQSLCLQRAELPPPGNATAASNAGLSLGLFHFYPLSHYLSPHLSNNLSITQNNSRLLSPHLTLT